MNCTKVWVLEMQRCLKVILLVVWYSTMTSFAMKSQKYVQMTNSTGAKVCSTDPPSQVLPMIPGGEIRCGIKCSMSSVCPYYQFKSTTLIQCELYNQFPMNFKSIDDCVGFRPSLPSILPRDCTDIWNFFGALVSGVYTVYVGSNYRPLAVYCDMNTTSGGWTVFQRRKDGSVNFYRNWTEYAQGFGDVSSEFWIGNDNLHLLTSARRYKIRIDLADFNNNTRYAEYDNFTVSSGADKYRLSSIGTCTGTGGDSLLYQLGQKFSTYDQDNDALSTNNCAVKFKGAWWYNDCHKSNLNGFYYGGPHASYGDGVQWVLWTGEYYSLKTTEMKIKPVN